MRIESTQSTFLGIDFAQIPLEPLAQQLLVLSARDQFSYIVTPNVDHVVQLHEGADQRVADAHRSAYAAAQYRVCDSRILELLAKWKGKELVVVPGSDLTAFLFERGLLNGLKVALVGGGEKTVNLLNARYPEVSVVQFTPPMGLLHDEVAQQTVVDFVRKSRCDVTMFAVGAPQSEIVAHQCLTDGRARGVGLCIGASIEFLTGEKSRAPRWLQRARLEWAFRLISEPRRLWRRYLIVGPRVLRLMHFGNSNPSMRTVSDSEGMH